MATFFLCMIYAAFISLGLPDSLLGAAWLLVFRDAEYNTMQSLLMGVVQGILCAGCSVYANQIYKQLKVEKEEE